MDAKEESYQTKPLVGNGNGITIIPDGEGIGNGDLPEDPPAGRARLPTALSQKTEARSRNRNWILACILLLSYVVLSVTSSQLTNYVFVDDSIDFKAPYLFTLLKMAFRLILFPIYLTVTAAIKIAKGKPVRISKTIKRCESVFGVEGLTLRSMTWKVLPAAVTMIIHQLTYTYGIANLTTSIATALFALAVAISYILSWLFLNNPLLLVKSVFVLVSLTGVGLISYASFSDEEKSGSQNATFGIVSVLISTLFLSLHQLAFKKAFPKGDLGQVSFALLCVFGFVCLIFWPVPLITKLVGEEVYDISLMPYDILIPTWLMSAVSSTVYGYGLVLSNPYFMSMGELATLAANGGIDASLRNIIIPISQIIGTVLIAIAFIVMILPDHIVSVRLRKPVPVVTTPPKEPGGDEMDHETKAEERKRLERRMSKMSRRSSTSTLNFIQSAVPDAILITSEEPILEEPHTPSEPNDEPFDPNVDAVYYIDDEEVPTEKVISIGNEHNSVLAC